MEWNKLCNQDSNQIRLSKSFVPISFDKSSFVGALATSRDVSRQWASGVSKIQFTCLLVGSHTLRITCISPWSKPLNKQSNSAAWWRLLSTAANVGTFSQGLFFSGAKLHFVRFARQFDKNGQEVVLHFFIFFFIVYAVLFLIFHHVQVGNLTKTIV